MELGELALVLLIVNFIGASVWAIVREAKRNHVSLPKTDRTGTLAAIDEMVEMDGQTSDILVDRVAGWRGRLLRSLVSTFRGGSLSVSEYEGEVDRVVRATEPEAIALAAKKAAHDAEAQRAAKAKAESDARTDKAWREMVRQMHRLLEIDVTPYKDTFSATNYPFSGSVVMIGGIRYVLHDHATTADNKQAWYVEVEKPCPYARKSGCFTGNIYTYTDNHSRTRKVVDLASLGAALEDLEQRHHCHSPICKMRHAGYTDEQIALAEAERERKEEDRRRKEQEEKLRTGWVDYTNGIAYGPGGRVAGYTGRGAYGYGQAYGTFSHPYRHYVPLHGVGFSHVPYDLWQRPITYRDVTSETA